MASGAELRRADLQVAAGRLSAAAATLGQHALSSGQWAVPAEAFGAQQSSWNWVAQSVADLSDTWSALSQQGQSLSGHAVAFARQLGQGDDVMGSDIRGLSGSLGQSA